MRKSSWLYGFLIGCVLSAELLAAEELETIVVSAARSQQSQVTTAASITVITREEIEKTAARHIVEVLRGRGGVQVRDLFGNGTRADISMRGFGANSAANTLILVDGRRLNNPDLAGPDLNSIALKDVERIEIVQGGAGVLFGDQAVGGVINIITRDPQGMNYSLEIAGGSDGREQTKANLAGRLDNGFGYRLSAEKSQADNYRDNSEDDYQNLFADLSYRYKGGEVFVEYQDINEEANLPGGLFQDQLDEDRKQTRFADDLNDTDTQIARIGLRQSISSNWHVEMEMTQRDSEIKGVLTGIDFEQDREVRSANPRLIGVFENKYGEAVLTLGADWDESEYSLASIFGVTNSNQETRAVYAQAVYPFTQRLTTTLGARRGELENDIQDAPSFLPTPVTINADDDATAYEAGLSFELAPATRLFARYDQVYRFPKVDEQTLTTNPGIEILDVQKGDSYEVGVDWSGRQQRLKAVIYRLDLEDEIDFDPSVGLFGANTNLDETRRNGFILEGATDIGEQLGFALQYTYTDAEFDKGVFSGNKIPLVSEHVIRATLDYEINPDWQVFAEWQYSSDAQASGDYANVLDKLPSYSVANLAASYARGPWKLSARVNNLFNQEYSDFAAKDFNEDNFFAEETGFYPAPERNFMVSLRYAFE